MIVARTGTRTITAMPMLRSLDAPSPVTTTTTGTAHHALRRITSHRVVTTMAANTHVAGSLREGRRHSTM